MPAGPPEQGVSKMEREEKKAGIPLKDRKVYIVGGGKSGLAALRFSMGRGARPCLNDGRKEQDFPPEILAELKEAGVALALGQEPDPLGFGAQLVVMSPGVPLDKPGLLAAARAGVPFTNEIELGYLSCAAPILAVTGSNGKTTVTSLLGGILKLEYPGAFVGGNIGRPFVEAAAELGEDQPAVLELSSFQLETIGAFRPRVAVILNLSPDHLDRHKTFENYCAMKWRITKNQDRGDWLILNYDDPLLRRGGLEILAGQAKEAGLTPGLPKGPRVLFFSRQEPLAEGLWLKGGSQLFLSAHGVDKLLFSAEGFALPGAHNKENLLAAAAAALAFGLPAESVRRGAMAFQAVEHRLEPVAEIGGVRYVNDSKATNVDAAIKALDSFEEPVVLIAGGRGKGASYRPFAEKIAEKASAVVLIGEDKDRIEKALLEQGFLWIFKTGSLEEAVELCRREARPGQVVLLAPACSSYDMFRNYEERGKAFKELVRRIAGAGEGKPCSN